jgi:glycerol-3-phosphate acyltransferase PlsX
MPELRIRKYAHEDRYLGRRGLGERVVRIALDAMGGDHAPREILLGALGGLRHLGPDDQLILFGPQQTVETELANLGISDTRLRIHNCTQIIEMGESPVEAVRQKRDSTIVQMAVAAGAGQIDALISAGNTGAFAAACQFKTGVIEGVSRPGIAIVMPTFHGPVVICDVGANVAPKPHHLQEYARMCTYYARLVLGVENPRVGVVSIGEEEGKGNPVVKEAHQLLKDDASIRFIGNIEGRDIFAGLCEVAVCDGYVGNVILKLTEGLAEGLFKTVVREIEAESRELLKLFEPFIERIWKKHDFAEYGGAPLLGIRSTAIICHGRSDQRAIANAVRVAGEQIRTNLNSIIAEHVGKA